MDPRTDGGRHRAVRAAFLLLWAVLTSMPNLAAGADRFAYSGFGEWYGLAVRDEPDASAGRIVVTFDHVFSSHASLTWELGLDHAGSEVEGSDHETGFGQAYVAVDLAPGHTLRLGVLALPVGLMNEADEPTAFFGAEINPVETEILPGGWCESGAAVGGPLGDAMAYDLAVTSGLSVPLEGEDAYRIAEGVQSVRSPQADSLAVTGRLTWLARPGVNLGVTGHYQTDVTGGRRDIGGLLLEAHADLRHGPLGFRALYARWDLDLPQGVPRAETGRSEQLGWYLEPSLRGGVGSLPGELGAFVRFSSWDTGAGDDTRSRNTRWNAGLNYWPVPELVLKLDAWTQAPGSVERSAGLGFAVGGVF